MQSPTPGPGAPPPGRHATPVTQDVHIVPLAREYDRAVLPFLAHGGKPAVLHAHRIILLVPDSEEARLVGTKVEKALRNVATVERYILAADRARPTAGFQGILQQVAWICRHEMEAGNGVHTNLSSGSKLVAFAAGPAGCRAILQRVAWNCRHEMEPGTRVHITPSSGSKPVAFAAGLAGMAPLKP